MEWSSRTGTPQSVETHQDKGKTTEVLRVGKIQEEAIDRKKEEMEIKFLISCCCSSLIKRTGLLFLKDGLSSSFIFQRALLGCYNLSVLSLE